MSAGVGRSVPARILRSPVELSRLASDPSRSPAELVLGHGCQSRTGASASKLRTACVAQENGVGKNYGQSQPDRNCATLASCVRRLDREGSWYHCKSRGYSVRKPPLHETAARPRRSRAEGASPRGLTDIPQRIGLRLQRAGRPRAVTSALLALALSACATPTVTRSCLTQQQYEQLKAAEPPKVHDKLTGKADEDVRPLAGSALELRSWGHALLDTLKICSTP